MDTRIFGLRNEYSVVFSAGGQRQLSPGEAGRRLARDIDIFEAKTVPSGPGRHRQAG